MTIRTSISKRDRKRTLTCGAVISQARFVLNFTDPITGKRRQLFHRSQREAIARRDSILAAIATNSYSESRNQMTVGRRGRTLAREPADRGQGFDLEDLWQVLLPRPTASSARFVGTPGERKSYREEGSKPDGTYFVEALGSVKVCDLTTGDIRRWHRTLLAEVGSRSANMSKTLLRAALSLAAEGLLGPAAAYADEARARQSEAKADPSRPRLRRASCSRRRGRIGSAGSTTRGPS